jgi:hypothetical protein
MIALQNGPCYVHITNSTGLGSRLFKWLSFKHFPETEFEKMPPSLDLPHPSMSTTTNLYFASTSAKKTTEKVFYS